MDAELQYIHSKSSSINFNSEENGLTEISNLKAEVKTALDNKKAKLAELEQAYNSFEEEMKIAMSPCTSSIPNELKI